MKGENAKNQTTTSRRDKGRMPSVCEGLGELQDNSRTDGTGQIGTAEEDNPGRNTTGYDAEQVTRNIKKILERLEALEERHLKYVKAHQDRLKARWNDDAIETEEFTKESNQLRTDIYNLAASIGD
jgi:hypothetical protein